MLSGDQQIFQEKNKNQILDIKIKNMEDKPPEIAKPRYISVPCKKEETEFIYEHIAPAFDEINKLMELISIGNGNLFIKTQYQ